MIAKFSETVCTKFLILIPFFPKCELGFLSKKTKNPFFLFFTSILWLFFSFLYHFLLFFFSFQNVFLNIRVEKRKKKDCKNKTISKHLLFQNSSTSPKGLSCSFFFCFLSQKELFFSFKFLFLSIHDKHRQMVLFNIRFVNE